MTHDGLHDRENGIVYDVDKIHDELGMIEKDGIRLLHDRQNGVLRIERMEPTIAQIKRDLERLEGEL